MRVSLAGMKAGQSGTVVEIHGGHDAADRLAALGIMPGRRIAKVSAMILRGPVTVRVGRTHVAIGFGMARRVFVEAELT
jgi:ferrous iron transport protein A